MEEFLKVVCEYLNYEKEDGNATDSVCQRNRRTY